MGSAIGWKSSGDPRIASTRLRCLSPLSELQGRGYPVEAFDPRRADKYAAVIYSKLHGKQDCQEALALKRQGVRIAFDLCDNRFYNPANLPEWVEAADRLRRMLTLADTVVAASETLAAVIRTEVPQVESVTVIGDAVETEIVHGRGPAWSRWLHGRALGAFERELDRDAAKGRTALVWFGNHGSPYADGGMIDLLAIRELLEELDVRYPLSLTVISNARWKYRDAIRPWRIPTRYLAWHPTTFLKALARHAVAVLPSRDNPFTRCKTNNRPALALAMGVAVVADPVPSYQPLERFCRFGDWRRGLEEYLAGPRVRSRDVEMGRAFVRQEWSIGTIASRWQTLFERLRGAD
jgi:hypothetical protein